MRVFTLSVVLSLLAGCGSGFGDPCSWLPKPNQEAVVDALFDFRVEGFSRDDLFAFFFINLANLPNVFDPTPEEFSFCLDDLLDQVYGP